MECRMALRGRSGERIRDIGSIASYCSPARFFDGVSDGKILNRQCEATFFQLLAGAGVSWVGVGMPPSLLG